MTTARRPRHPLRRAAGTLAAIALISAAGCTADTPEQPPADPPTTTASPTESKRDQEARERIDIATTSLDALTEEQNRIWEEGGASKATPTLKKYATGTLLEELTDVYAMIKEQKLRREGEPTVLLTQPQGVGSPERVDLVQCIDRSTATVTDENGKKHDDGVEQTKLIQSYQVQLVDDQWKVATSETTLLNDWDRSPCDGSWEKGA